MIQCLMHHLRFAIVFPLVGWNVGIVNSVPGSPLLTNHHSLSSLAVSRERQLGALMIEPYPSLRGSPSIHHHTPYQLAHYRIRDRCRCVCVCVLQASAGPEKKKKNRKIPHRPFPITFT
uniref:Putative secreted protein n=1 Tax=Anopheles marajoara TaxID=58244 RepID=A0A2M4C8G2_9DIPT